MKVLDISEHQGNIDFDLVKPQVSGIMIRAGHGMTLDKKWERNARECERTGIPFGAYWFCEARTAEAAKAEAEMFLTAIRPYKLDYPVAYDFEEYSVYVYMSGVEVTKELCTAICETACRTLEEAGYYTMLYTNPNCMNQYQDMSVLGRYDLWLASWYTKPNLAKPPQPCGLWQWGGSLVDGITPGQTVDTNEAYRDFPKLIRDNGLNVPKSWYTEPRKWAVENGILKDGEEEDIVTKGQVAEMFYEYDKKFSGLLTDD